MRRYPEPVWMYGAIAAYAAAVLAADVLSPAAIAVWVLYVPVLVVCKLLTWRTLTPLGIAVGLCALLVVGFFLGHQGEPELQSIRTANRTIMGVMLLALGVVGRQVVAYRIALRTQDWSKAGQSGLAALLQGDRPLATVGQDVLQFLAAYVDAQVGALFVGDASGAFTFHAGYSRGGAGFGGRVFHRGDGLVGQVAATGRVLVVDEVPAGYSDVRSGLGAATPRVLILLPTTAHGEVDGVLELGFFARPDGDTLDLLASVGEPVGLAIRSALDRARQAELLEETQRQGEELQAQQEELQQANEALAEETNRLKASQEELEETNAQLEEHTQAIEAQKEALLATQLLLQRRGAEVDRASRYKSEFLANMSHELRTPLNSSLILARLLAENRDGNLTDEQVKYAESISTAGMDLLALIDGVLDLAKIEAGRMELAVETVRIAALLEEARRRFEPLATQRGLALVVATEPGCPEALATDRQKLQQVLANLLSNALKFTEAGSVDLSVRAAGPDRIAFAVRDTGIGIAAEQHGVIFEAFRQADGSTHRKYGGTGLGLSICRELVTLLGGTLELESAPREGSTFSVVLPSRTQSTRAARTEDRKAASSPRPSPVLGRPLVLDDREATGDPRRVVLVVEDDPAFAEILRDLARELGYRCVVAGSASDALLLAPEVRAVAILLDIGLPDHSGLTVLELLKRDASTRHVPIHVVSVHDYRKVARELGAVGYALKPVKREELVAVFRRLEERLAREVKRVLLVEDDPVQQAAIADLLRADRLEVVPVATATDALARIEEQAFDCAVVDLGLPDENGLDLLERMAADGCASFPPIIVYTARTLTPDEERRLRGVSSSIIVKGARSPERLLEEVTLFAHQVEAELPEDRRRMLEAVRDRERIFEGRRVLLVEDDVRNIFALTRVLEPKGLAVDVARNGREAVERMAKEPQVDAVLMDVMMPEMDGLAATRALRADPRFATTPILALTAKAMPDDRRACLEAGASDYIAKPIDVEKLLSLLRVWMPR